MSRWLKNDHSINLSYCLNIHPSYTLEQIRTSIEKYTLPLKERIAPDRKMGLGIRFSLPTVDHLRTNKEELEEFQEFLTRNDLYVYTINAFPAGEFQSQKQKEDVFRPTWLEEDRVRFSKWAGRLQAELLPDSLDIGTVSTLPGTFKTWGNSTKTWDHIMGNMLRVVHDYWKLKKETGKKIVLCIEPEPLCTFEETSEIMSFFKDYLLTDGARQYQEAFGLSEQESSEMIREHLGVCLDTAHLAVRYEDVVQSMKELQNAGIQIGKIQISSAPVLLSPSNKPDGRNAFLNMDENSFLHQTYGRDSDGNTHSVRDLSELRGAVLDEWKDFSEWRTHFHVPVFLEKFGKIHTTQEHLTSALNFSLDENLCSHYEIETYSWNVLPISERKSLNITNLIDVLENEFFWVHNRLQKLQYSHSGE